MSKPTIDSLLANNEGKLPAYAWPGGYPIFYVDRDCSILCPDCANKALADPDEIEEFKPIGWDINYEDDHCYCGQCNEHIDSAYGDPDEATNQS